MYKHILIPLDGSHLAEQVLPHALANASLSGHTRITLLRTIPLYHPAQVEGSLYFEARMQEVVEAEQAARSYLEQMAQPIRVQGYEVAIELSHLPAEEAIIDYAEKHDVDLITMATHGRSGMRRWLLGSVTQKVVHTTPVPILVIRPEETETAEDASSERK